MMRLRRWLAAAAAALLCTYPAAGAAGQAPAEPSAAPCTPLQLNASALLPRTGVAVSPVPGSRAASPHTQISFVGVPGGSLLALRVHGSRTGPHAGRLARYSQGDGASFIPRTPFTSGEAVTVSGAVRRGRGVVRFSYSFIAAREDPVPYAPVHHPSRDPNEKQHYHSAPNLEPPSIEVTAQSSQTAPGYLLTAPYAGPGQAGPAIFDETGALVWFDPLPSGTEATNLQMQQLFGKPVLTWWQGYIPRQGFGEGEDVIADSSYREIGRVHAGNGYTADLHDFHITPQGTALLTAFAPVYCNLAPWGGPRAGAVTDTLFQEVDLRTGLVRREWHALDHVGLSESRVSAAGTSRLWPFDYFHLNSVDQAAGRTLVSARNTWGMYDLDTRSGRVETRIGGRRPNVRAARGAATAFQHDAERQPDGTISIFDNGAVPRIHAQSRGMLVSVDPHSRTERVVATYTHPRRLLSGSQGNMQILENGDVFIGWGSTPYFSEFSRGGTLLFDAHMHGSYQSYRVYRAPWTGAPSGAPAVALGGAPGTPRTVYVSWNGDTRTASWLLLGGSSPSQLFAVAQAPRTGFETTLAAPSPEPYLALQALDADGNVLTTSAALRC